MLLLGITIHSNDCSLQVEEFLELANKVWPNSYDIESTQIALTHTINATARHTNKLIGCARLLTDEYFFAVVTEIFVHPKFQSQGLGKRLLDALYQESPCSIFLGAQVGNEGFFEKCGYQQRLTSYTKYKPRRVSR